MRVMKKLWWLIRQYITLQVLRVHATQTDNVVVADSVQEDAPASSSTEVATAAAAAPEQQTPRHQQRKPRHRPSDDSADIGVHWRFRKDILDRLDEYFFCLRRMRDVDPSRHALLSKTGISIPADYVNPQHASEFVKSHRPAFGGVLIPSADDEDSINPSFIYFYKVKSPGRVQLVTTGDIYAVTAIYDDRQSGRSKLVAPIPFYVHIDAAGSVTLLRQAVTVKREVEHRKKKGHRKETLLLDSVQWRYPKHLEWMASENAAAHSPVRRKYTTPEAIASYFFNLSLGTYVEGHRKIVIRVHAGKETAAFNIDLKRCPHFFKDRDSTVLAADGRKKRIFHSVVKHHRHLVSGHDVEVKQHYRGTRFFDWNGYRVVIVLPSHLPLYTFDAACRQEEDMTPEEWQHYIADREVGEHIAKVLDA